MRRLFRFAAAKVPRISATERIALRSGTVGIEREAFAGTLSARTLLERYTPATPTANDVAMLGRVPDLLRTVDEYDTLRARGTPASHPFWAHARAHDFFGLIVPEEYGGTPLSSTGLSRLLQRLASCSASAPVHIMVPASLGPAELLVHYGTDAQRARWLPRLARGAIPCFGLTSLEAGSDAAGSMVDTGTVERGADGNVRLRLSCRKRYITLAPVADVVGLAFKVVDPDGLLGAQCGRPVDGEITLALVERGAAGLRLGERLDPLGVGFENGLVDAEDLVLCPVADVIGGLNGVGQGWKYLMEALAAGRGVALPAGAAGSTKMLTCATSGYAALRTQFKVPLIEFEGVQEKVAAMALATYEVDALVAVMNCALDAGERPPVLSAVLKQRTTELQRAVVQHSMDIVAGSAICMGPNNFVAPAYLSTPIGITVEGSNTMTRSLLIFGQGVVRSKPHLLEVLDAIEEGDEARFGAAVRDLATDTAWIAVRSTSANPIEQYVRFFALSSTASLALGGDLKRREAISGRYADLLSLLLAGVATEWHAAHAARGVPDWFVEAVRQDIASRLSLVSAELVRNHPHRWLHAALLWRTAGGRIRPPPTDRTLQRVAREVARPDSPLRELFLADTLAVTLHPNVRRIEEALRSGERDPQALRPIFEVDVAPPRDDAADVIALHA